MKDRRSSRLCLLLATASLTCACTRNSASHSTRFNHQLASATMADYSGLMFNLHSDVEAAALDMQNSINSFLSFPSSLLSECIADVGAKRGAGGTGRLSSRSGEGESPPRRSAVEPRHHFFSLNRNLEDR